MTNGNGPGPQAAEMIRRLRARPVSSWRHGRRAAVMRSAVQRLADLAADAAGRPRRPVPNAGPAAFADQLAVLLAQAHDDGVPPEALALLLEDLAGALAVR